MTLEDCLCVLSFLSFSGWAPGIVFFTAWQQQTKRRRILANKAVDRFYLSDLGIDAITVDDMIYFASDGGVTICKLPHALDGEILARHPDLHRGRWLRFPSWSANNFVLDLSVFVFRICKYCIYGDKINMINMINTVYTWRLWSRSLHQF